MRAIDVWLAGQLLDVPALAWLRRLKALDRARDEGLQQTAALHPLQFTPNQGRSKSDSDTKHSVAA